MFPDCGLLRPMTNESTTEEPLVGDETLLEALFPNDRDRPGRKWLADLRKSGQIPYLKIGAKVIRYKVSEVREAIDRNFSAEKEGE
jgi:hypothetical protein